MEVVNNTLIKDDKINRPQIEQIINRKMEYTLLGSYQLKRGMKLFSYNYANGEILEIVIKRGNYITCELTTEGWISYDPENYNVKIDSKLEYFQSPSITIAKNLVRKLKEGKIKQLFNLTPPSKGINLFEHI